MSLDLVRRWRRLARLWTEAAESCERRQQPVQCSQCGAAAEVAACRARADAYAECAESLERSIALSSRHPEQLIAHRQRVNRRQQVLAAPPCTEFSLAKNGHPRDFLAGLECVNACMRIVLTAAPRWWALENPVGLLGRWLGEPRDVFEPFDFGDAWSKRTALWGSFTRPQRGPRVRPIDGGGPICVVCHPDNPRVCSLAEHRAVTAPGFARAFFEANP